MTDTPPAQPSPAHPSSPRKRVRRCNADYRWTMPKVTAFLEALCECGSVAEAARSVGMGRQSAYRLRARLAQTQYAAAFENARREGQRVRAAEMRARNRSRWDGQTLAAFLHSAALERQSPAMRSAAQANAQGDTAAPQGDITPPKGDADRDKATGSDAKRHLPSGQCNTCNMPPRCDAAHPRHPDTNGARGGAPRSAYPMAKSASASPSQ